MRISALIWLEDIVQKLEQKHGVAQGEVRDVLRNCRHFRFVEKGHRPGENLYAALGRSDAGRYLAVFFIFKRTGQALVLSARDMTLAERKRYERK